MPTIPYRTEELSRERNANRANRPNVKNAEMMPVYIEPADPNWHPTAIRLYDSLAESGQSVFFQQSDWAYAWSLCEDISVLKFMQIKTGKPHAEALKALYTAMQGLMFTEADRRKLRIELKGEEDDEDLPSVSIMSDYKKRLKVAE